MPAFGLGVVGRPHVKLPVTRVDVDAKVLDCLAHVVLRQTYANPAYATTLDCEYTFPMDPSAAVNRLVVTVGDRVVHGVVMERAAADARFDEAVAVGDGAYRVARSPTSADVFLASIGNLLPGETAVVQIEYVAPVALEGSCLRFCLPTAVAPRYAGLTPWTTRFAASTVPAQFPLRVSVDFAVASDIVTVGCPGARMAAVGSHDGGQPEVVGPGVFAGAWHGGCVEASVGRSAAVVTLSVPDSVGLESDFVVTVAEVQPHQPRVWVERFVAGEVASGVADAPAAAAETEAVMVAMYPDLANATYARDPQLTYTFILDCSGSMGGSNIARAKQALALCLRSLPVASHFQVVAFGWKFHSAFEDGPRQYNDASLAAATDFVLALQANLGGTEIRAPLKAAFAGANRNTPLQVFLFTDGSVADTDAVVADCKRGFAETGSRVFTFGIGTDASAALVRGCAEAAGGQAEFIMGDEPMDEKVLRQLARSIRPVLTNVRVDWGAFTPYLAMPSSPEALVPLYANGRALVFAVLDTSREGLPIGADVTISATCPDGPLSWTVPVTRRSAVAMDPLPDAVACPSDGVLRAVQWCAGATIHAAAVKARLLDLEAQDGDAAKADAVALAVRFGIGCKWASMIAIDTRSTSQRAAALSAREVSYTPPDGVSRVHAQMCLSETCESSVRELSADVMQLCAGSKGPQRRKSRFIAGAASVGSAVVSSVRAFLSGGRDSVDMKPPVSQRAMAPAGMSAASRYARGGSGGLRGRAALDEDSDEDAESDGDTEGGRAGAGAGAGAGDRCMPAASAPDTVVMLLRAVCATGFWEPSDALRGVLAASAAQVDAFQALVDGAAPPDCDARTRGRLWATVSCIALLRSRHMPAHPIWVLVEHKAVWWLREALGVGTDDVLAAAQALW